MSTTKEIEAKARKLCRHTITYTQPVDAMCAVRAMQGRTTLSIAEELGLSISQVSYRIIKAQKWMKTRFRSEYRNGTSSMAMHMLRATEKFGIAEVREHIAPHFIPFGKQGVPRIPRG